MNLWCEWWKVPRLLSNRKSDRIKLGQTWSRYANEYAHLKERSDETKHNGNSSKHIHFKGGATCPLFLQVLKEIILVWMDTRVPTSAHLPKVGHVHFTRPIMTRA